MAKAKKRESNLLPIIVLLMLAAGLLVGFRLLGPNVTKKKYLYVRTGATYQDLLDSVSAGGYLIENLSFRATAQLLHLNERMRPGRYLLTKGMSNLNLVRMLRNGQQAEVKLTINKLRTKQELVTLLANNLEADEQTIDNYLNDSAVLRKLGLDANTLMCLVIPNTFRFYWNTPPSRVVDKLYKNYSNFWNESRLKLAEHKGLTPQQITTIASIVEEETNLAADKPSIASVYLNRLKKGMKLQADPTVKFALGNFLIKRVTGEMLKTESAYNTYYTTGLPPGPICTPMPSTIDAVLNAPETKYIYFCAKDDLSGASVFAATGEEHLKNARAYQKELNARGIH